MIRKRNNILAVITLAAFITGAALAFGVAGNTTSFAKEISYHERSHTEATLWSGHSTVDFAVPGVDPWGTAFDRHGNVWVALPGCDPAPRCSAGTPPGKIAEFNPGNQSWMKVYQLPAGFGQPLFLAFDTCGNLWFPMPMSDSLGELTPTGVISQWQVPTPDAGPWDVAVDGHGTVWLTEHYTNKIASFNARTHSFREIATPASNSQPYGIIVDHANNIWFTENSPAVALIGEYTAHGKLNEYKIRNGSTANLTPHLITVDGRGNVWWSEGFAGAVGKLDVSQAQAGTTDGVTEYAYQGPCSMCGTHTSGIAVDHKGVIWFTDSLQSIYGSFNGASFTLHNTPTPNSHPHDGLNVAGNNVIWFDEEFANKLARHS